MAQQHLLQACAQHCDQTIAINNPAKLLTQRGPRLINIRVIQTHIDVDTDTHNNVADICRITDQLQQDATNFPRAHQNIIRPLQTSALESNILERPQNCEPYNQTQSVKIPGASFNSPGKTEIHILPIWAYPLTTAATAPLQLLLCKHQKWRAGLRTQKPQRIRICRVDLLTQKYWPTHTGSLQRA